MVTNQRSRGFTLVELMITLVVAAILGGIAVPNIRTFVQNGRLTEQANHLLKDLSGAVDKAQNMQKNTVICRSVTTSAAVPSCATTGVASWETGWIVFIDMPAGGTVYNNDYKVADGDVLVSVHPPLGGNNTLRPNNSEMANNIVFQEKTGKPTLNPVAAGTAPNLFKLCDIRGINLARIIAVKPPGVSRGATLTQFDVTGVITTFPITCP